MKLDFSFRNYVIMPTNGVLGILTEILFPSPLNGFLESGHLP